MCVCKTFDPDYAEGNPRWQVILNNDETIYSDNNNPSAWIRLDKYCKDKGLHISSMSFGFRSNMVHLPANADGYFFCKGARGLMGADRTLQLFIVGTLQNGVLSVQYWKVPEMLPEQTEERDPTGAGECLIR